jgi:hypothetical protein
MKIFLGIASTLSVVFATLLFINIYSKYGVRKALLICLAGAVVIWVLGYLKARLFGWVGPGRRKDEHPDQHHEG